MECVDYHGFPQEQEAPQGQPCVAPKHFAVNNNWGGLGKVHAGHFPKMAIFP